MSTAGYWKITTTITGESICLFPYTISGVFLLGKKTWQALKNVVQKIHHRPKASDASGPKASTWSTGASENHWPESRGRKTTSLDASAHACAWKKDAFLLNATKRAKVAQKRVCFSILVCAVFLGAVMLHGPGVLDRCFSTCFQTTGVISWFLQQALKKQVHCCSHKKTHKHRQTAKVLAFDVSTKQCLLIIYIYIYIYTYM